MEKQEIRTFGRRHGKKLSIRKQWLVENILPTLIPNESEHTDILEIGFGAGEHVRALAIENPDKIIIGAEPFVNGVAALLSAICDTNNNILPEYKNIRIWPDDVRLILGKNTIKFSEIWVLHPDPWPKARHEKRRLLNREFLETLSKKLAPTGKIIIGTDHWGYYDWIIEQIPKNILQIDTTDMPVIETRYQKKNMAETSATKYIILNHAQKQ